MNLISNTGGRVRSDALEAPVSLAHLQKMYQNDRGLMHVALKLAKWAPITLIICTLRIFKASTWEENNQATTLDDNRASKLFSTAATLQQNTTLFSNFRRSDQNSFLTGIPERPICVMMYSVSFCDYVPSVLIATKRI